MFPGSFEHFRCELVVPLSLIVTVCTFRSLTFVFPFGATLNVVKPAISVLSSGSVSFPLNRPVCAFHSSRVSSFQVYNPCIFLFLTLQRNRSLKTYCNH